MTLSTKFNEFPLCNIDHISACRKRGLSHDYCITGPNKDFLCITPQLKLYIQQRFSYYHSFPHLQKASDWDHLEQASKSHEVATSKHILEFFSKSGSYRLRYKVHTDLGIACVREILKKQYFSNVDFQLWGKDQRRVKQTISQCIHHFDELCKTTKRDHPENMYRLFDLYSPFIRDGLFKPLNTADFKLIHFLSMMFAFGEGKFNPQVETLSDLAAKYEFFRAIYQELIESCRTEQNLSANDAVLKVTELIISNEGLELIQDTWNKYTQAASKILSVPSYLLHHQLSKELSNDTLKIGNFEREVLSYATKVANQLLQFPSLASGAYHCLKHRRETNQYFNEEHIPLLFDKTSLQSDANASMQSYAKMISHILTTGIFNEVKPCQFTSAVGLTFIEKKKFQFKERSKEKTFMVIVRVTSDGSSCMLTCF